MAVTCPHSSDQAASNDGKVGFQNNKGDTGVVILDHSNPLGGATGFKRTVAGFYSDGIDSDTLDLQDIKFATGVSWSLHENSYPTQGVLKVKDGSR
jgi:hypothetical protein